MRHVTDTLFSFNFSECVTLVIDLFFYSNFTLWNSKVTYYHGTESEILKLYLQGGPKKTGPAGFIANILKTSRPNCVEVGELLQYCMLNAVITFFFKSFVALWRHLTKNVAMCDAQIYLYNVNKRQQHFNRIHREQNYSHCGNFRKSQFMKLLI